MTVGDLKKYKDGCYAALSRDLTEFEKNFLFISGGILAFSTTFIKDIVKVPEITSLYLLFVAWALIIVSIGLMMNSFLKSANASDSLVNIVDDFQVEHSLYKESTELSTEQWVQVKKQIQNALRTSKKELKLMRKWAVQFFLAGVALFSFFVSLNLLHEKNKGIQANSNIKPKIIKNNDSVIFELESK